MKNIERSTGTPIRVNGLPTGFLAGGGYSGCTDKLDRTVQAAAELLTREFGCKIQIRFNSDRESGGAFIEPPPAGELGICAGYLLVPPKGMSRGKWMGLPIGTWREVGRKRFYVASNVGVGMLRNPLMADKGYVKDETDHRYSYRFHRNIAGALVWILEHVDRATWTTLHTTGKEEING
ncbi:MAG: hypothetical protein HYT87_13000 [Nitrospirae bacterium]|nr:hypothetical protein [Nitrospirota bacterium]